MFDPQVEQAAQQYAQMMGLDLTGQTPSSRAAATPAGGPSASGAFRNSSGLVTPAVAAAMRTVENGLPSPAGRMGGGLVRDIPIPEEPDLPFGAPRPMPSAPPMGEGVPPMGEGVPAMGVGVAPYGSTTPPMGTGVPPMGTGVPAMGSTTPPMVAPVDAAIQALAGSRALRSGPRGGRSQNVTAPSQFANQGSNQAEWLANLRGGLEAKMRSQARPSQKQNEMTSGMQALLSMFMGRPAV